MTNDLDVLADGLAFPECPRWHGGRLWISEKRGGRVVTVAADGEVTPVVDVPGGPGGLGWAADGALLVVDAAGRRVLRHDGTKMHEHADLSSLTIDRCNDMIVDATGRAYVGHFGYDLLAGAPPAAASLVLVDPDGSARTVAEDLAFPNGCALSPDGQTLLVAESAAARLTAFTVGPDGGLGGRRVFAELAPVVPDGIALDEKGGVWVSDPVGCALVRIDADGEVCERVSTAPFGAFACELGGDDGRVLFACLYTEAASQLAEDAPAVGRVATMRVEVPGVCGER